MRSPSIAMRQVRLQGSRMPPRNRTRTKARPNSIAGFRMAAGMTQEELALKVTTTKDTIYRLETGGMQLTQTWAERLSAHLGCDPSDLMRHEEPLAALAAVGLPTQGVDVTRSMQMLNAIGELIRSGAYWDAASSCRTLAKLLTNVARDQASGRAEN